MRNYKLRRLSFAIGLGVLGWAINLFPVKVFGKAHVAFGSVFSILVAASCGPVYGLLSTLIISFRLSALDSYALPVLFLGAEAVFVGLLCKKRFSPLVADAIFWVFIGFPGAILATVMVAQLPEPDRWAIAIKSPVNGLINAAFAELLLIIFSVRTFVGSVPDRDFARTPFRFQIWKEFVIVSSIPILLLTVYNGNHQARILESQAKQTLNESSATIARSLDDYLDRHRKSIVTLARVFDDLRADRDKEKTWLEFQHRTYDGFITMLATDAEGNVIARHPERRPSGDKIPLDNVSDRAYFKHARDQQGPFVSDVFLGRGFGTDPIVAISCAYFQDGKFAGIVEGSLNLEKFHEVVRPFETDGRVAVLIADANNRVIYSGPNPVFKPLQVLDQTPLLKAALATGDNSFSYTSGKDEWLSGRAISQYSNWKIYAQRPMMEIRNELRQYYLRTAFSVAIVIFVLTLLSIYLSAFVTKPLDSLVQAVRRLRSHSDDKPTVLAISQVERDLIPLEISELMMDFDDLQIRLRDSYSNLQASLSEREQLNLQMRSLLEELDNKVQERTAELVAAKKKAEESSSAKSAFLANMSHEVRTPMNAVLGLTNILIDSDLDPAQREYAETIRDSAELLLAILDDILDFSKIESGKLKLECIDFNLASVIKSTITLFSPRASEKRLHLESYISPEIPFELRGDPLRLRQVLTNLISNALKFTTSGSIVVKADVLKQSGPETTLIFSVVDTGIGIHPDRHNELFQPFTQADNSTTRRFGGTGLGLAICRQLVDLMGGEIGFESEPGQGSTFWFSAHFQSAASPRRASLRPVEPKAATSELLNRQLPLTVPADNEPAHRILLAEDNAVNQLVAKLHLNRLGYVVDVVNDGKAAIEALKVNRYAAVLMDCQMPVMDGFEATSEIRNLEAAGLPRTAIIALTANAMEGEREKCLAAGMDDYMAKPFTPEGVRDVVARWVNAQPEADVPNVT